MSQIHGYGTLKRRTIVGGKMIGTSLLRVVGEENIELVKELALQKGLTETAMCNSLLNERLTQLRAGVEDI